MILTPLNRAKGFTLIELMVALAIGLLITLVVLQAYLSGVGTQRAQTDAARAQESSRIAFDLLSHSLRQAGYKNPKAPGFGYCDSTIQRIATINDPATINPTAANLVGSTVTVVNNSDAVKVRYFGEGLPVSPFTTDNSIRDCLGNPVATNSQVEDTLFVATDANNNEPTLYCYTTNDTARGNVPLVAGIESMQLLYGEDTDGDGIINRYIHGGSISAPNNIRSVKLSIIARTPGTAAVDRSARNIDHFGTDYSGYVAQAADKPIFTTPADGRTRRHTTTTIALRNLCPV